MKARNLLIIWSYLALELVSTAQTKTQTNLRDQELGVDFISSKIRTRHFNPYFERRSLTLLNGIFYRYTTNNRTAFRAEANFSKNRATSFNQVVIFMSSHPELDRVRDYKLTAGMQFNTRTMKLWPRVIPHVILYAFSDLYFR